MTYKLSDLLAYCLQTGGTELVVAEGMFPALRIQGRIHSIPGAARVPAPFLQHQLDSTLSVSALSLWQTHGHCSVCEGPWLQRLWRVRLSRQALGGIAYFKPVAQEAPDWDTLHIPDALRSLPARTSGLILFSGPSGSGKSTTAAAFASSLCAQGSLRIRLLQQIPEFHLKRDRNLVHCVNGIFDMEKEIRVGIRAGTDLFFTGDYPLEKTDALLDAAESGALVIATVQAGSLSGVMERISGRQGGPDREKLRGRLAQHLKAVVIQHLLPARNGRERVPAWEIIHQNPAFAAAIRANEYFRFPQILQAGIAEGMLPLDESLLQLVQAGHISSQEAARVAFDPGRFQ